MIKINVKGSAAEILKVQRTLREMYGKAYAMVVKECIPEAVQYGSRYCAASFILSDSYRDLGKIMSMRGPEMEIVFKYKIITNQEMEQPVDGENVRCT